MTGASLTGVMVIVTMATSLENVPNSVSPGR